MGFIAFDSFLAEALANLVPRAAENLTPAAATGGCAGAVSGPVRRPTGDTRGAARRLHYLLTFYYNRLRR